MKTASRTTHWRGRVPAEDVCDDLDAAHLDWSDIPPPRDIIRARRDGHLVRIPKPVLVIDSGESRCGYTFERFSKWIAGTEQRRLRDGDYSVKGLERFVTIERKSPADAVSSVMPPLRATFLERCRRMTRYTRHAIVIEASYAAMRSSYEAFTESQAHPNAVIGSYLAIQERWGIRPALSPSDSASTVTRPVTPACHSESVARRLEAAASTPEDPADD